MRARPGRCPTDAASFFLQCLAAGCCWSGQDARQRQHGDAQEGPQELVGGPGPNVRQLSDPSETPSLRPRTCSAWANTVPMNTADQWRVQPWVWGSTQHNIAKECHQIGMTS